MFCASPVNVGWAWSSDCFGRLSPNLCCLFQALLIVMCSIAVYLQRKHDLTWLAVCVQSQGERYASVNKRLYSFLRKRVRFNQFTSISPRIGVWKLFDLRQACDPRWHFVLLLGQPHVRWQYVFRVYCIFK